MKNLPRKKSIVENNMNFYIINGILFTVMTCLYKSYADKFITRLGGNSLHLSLYNALPGLMGFFSIIPGIILMSKTKNKKSMMGKFFLLSRCTVLLYAFVPFLPKEYRALGFIILFALMNIPESLSVMSLQSFSGDIFPEDKRSTGIAMRNKFSILFNILISMTLGLLFKKFSNNNASAILLYQICFVVAFIVGLIELSTFMKLKEITSVKMDKLTIKDLKIQTPKIFKNKNFKLFLCCSLLFHFGWQMGWPLFSIYKLNYLHADEMWITILNVSSSIVMFFSYNFWNKLIKKKGNSYVIFRATFGMSITPILYMISPNLYILTMTGIMTGFFTSGTVTVILSSLLEVCPQENRIFYIGIHSTLTNLTLTIAPMFGNTILNHSSIYIALLVSALIRFAGSFAFYLRKKKLLTQSSQ